MTGQFADFCRAIGLAELSADPRFARIRDRMPHKAELIPLIEGALAKKSADEWVEVLNSAGVACGPLHNIASMIEDPQVVHRGVLREMPDPNSGRLRFVANPIRLSETPVSYNRPPPRLGRAQRGGADRLAGAWPRRGGRDPLPRAVASHDIRRCSINSGEYGSRERCGGCSAWWRPQSYSGS